MLVLSRKTGERISIGEEIQVIVLEVAHGRVKLGFEAPRDIPVRRCEVEFYREVSFDLADAEVVSV